MLFNRRQITDDGDVEVVPATHGAGRAALCMIELRGTDGPRSEHPRKFLDRQEIDTLIAVLEEARS